MTVCSSNYKVGIVGFVLQNLDHHHPVQVKGVELILEVCMYILYCFNIIIIIVYKKNSDVLSSKNQVKASLL